MSRRRSVRLRITAVATAGTLAVLLGLALLSSRMIGPLLVDSADDELRPALDTAVAAVSAGAEVRPVSPNFRTRVLDTAGAPADGAAAPELTPSDIRTLKAGVPVLRLSDSPPARWLGTVATAPDGAQRLVVVGTGLAGYDAARGAALRWLITAAVIAAAATALATWSAVRSAMRPVGRLRAAAARLGAGKRLPLPESRELRALAAAMNDLLARRDEAADRLRRFTGDAAHELRSPVASIRVQAEVAVAHPDPELAQEVLADVARESQRLSALVDGLLTLARSDAGELPAASAVDLSVAAADAAVRCAVADGPAIRVHAPPGSCWVYAAPSEVDLVLDNLLRNAVRHARARVVLTVLTAGRTARVVVDDDGHGIAEEHRAKVFDRFYRVQDDRARSSGGTGLGLALVAEVVRRRGGAVRVGESPEGGARFQVTWRTASV
ncbi:sensor histidine kinase [Actinokineospora spheciospongiae]|uniref:sensor histidine kinase n=1 Tax=Actinokineospora spheciospongiae TaxID=909613 RepID=UPI000D94429A|nr:HAMP domain-containing sensor histidine kinase [Actinokineospora spheciospongiae]PWW65411.1 signal transduction histidine kinase [Actinokineospora spheciospongiae]